MSFLTKLFRLLLVGLFLFVLTKGGAECSFNQNPSEYLCGNIEFGAGELTIDSSWFNSDFGYSNDLFLDSIDISINLESTKKIVITAHLIKGATLDGLEIASWNINEAAGAHVILLSESGLYDTLQEAVGGDYVLYFTTSDPDATAIIFNSWCIKNICNIYDPSMVSSTQAVSETLISSIACSLNNPSDYICGSIEFGSGELTISDENFDSEFGSIDMSFLDSIEISIDLESSNQIDIEVFLETSGTVIASWNVNEPAGAHSILLEEGGLRDRYGVTAGGDYLLTFGASNPDAFEIVFNSWCIRDICYIYESIGF